MPKLRKTGVPHLVWRGSVAYWSRKHSKLPGGRVVRSLEVRRDREDLAATYAGALNTLCERGDWNVVARWSRGEIHITEAARAVREGDYARLNRLNADGSRLGQATDAFVQQTRATLEETTEGTYSSILRQLLNEFGEDYPMVALSTDRAQAFLHAPKTLGSVQKREITWAAATQHNARTIYKALWNAVIEREREEADRAGTSPVVTLNPWMKARIPRKRKTRQSFLSRAQWQALITHRANARTPRDAMLCAGIMGLRLAEIQHLRTDKDVVLDASEPYIEIQPRKGRHAWRPKTDYSIRTLPIPPKLVPHFRYHREHLAGADYFIISEAGDKPIHKSTIRTWVMDAFTFGGVRYGREGDALTLHSLRHSCATWMLSEGVPLPSVAKWLGDTKEIVLSTYGHAMPADDARALQAMEAML